MSLSYTLSVLTHGDCATLPRALASFAEHVNPKPERAIVHCDGLDAATAFGEITREYPQFVTAQLCSDWGALVSQEPVGFCEATSRLWREVAKAGPKFVFWLEHDFEFLRRIDLEPLAAVLLEEPKLAQMQLMRGPVNEQEVAAGGLFESRLGEYQSRGEWLEHRAYLTTNPSLMRASFMRHRAWPDHPEFCEGKFGLELIESGYTFGVWGAGEPWVDHVGVRSGFGY